MFPMHSAPILRCSPSTSAVCPPVIRLDHGNTHLGLYLLRIERSGHRFICVLFIFYCLNHIPYIFGNLGTVNWIVPTTYHSMHFSSSFIPNPFVISPPIFSRQNSNRLRRQRVREWHHTELNVRFPVGQPFSLVFFLRFLASLVHTVSDFVLSVSTCATTVKSSSANFSFF